jgi:BASS family bile acid:Na+ symporter
LAFAGRHAGVALALGIAVGIAAPALAHLARPLLVPSIVGLLALSLLHLDGGDLRRIGRYPVLLGASAAWLLVASPAHALLGTGLLLSDAKLSQAIVLSAACPPVMSTIAFALMLGFDAALASWAVLSTLVLVPFTLPLIALYLLGVAIEIDPWTLALRLAGLIAAAVAFAALARLLIARRALQQSAHALDGLAVVLLWIFAVAIMDGVAASILDAPSAALITLSAAFLANAGLQCAALLVFWAWARPRALSMGIASGNRNLGLLLAALGPATDPAIVLYLALGQIPIYLTPLARPLYSLLRRSRSDEAGSSTRPPPSS